MRCTLITSQEWGTKVSQFKLLISIHFTILLSNGHSFTFINVTSSPKCTVCMAFHLYQLYISNSHLHLSSWRIRSYSKPHIYYILLLYNIIIQKAFLKVAVLKTGQKKPYSYKVSKTSSIVVRIFCLPNRSPWHMQRSFT